MREIVKINAHLRNSLLHTLTRERAGDLYMVVIKAQKTKHLYVRSNFSNDMSMREDSHIDYNLFTNVLYKE